MARLTVALPTVPFALVLGLAGTGKSALVTQFAHTWTGAVLVVSVKRSRPGADLFDDLDRALSPGDAGRAGDRDRQGDLARLLDRDTTLLVIEDADRLDGDGRALLAELIARITVARVIATARSHVYAPGEGPEHLQLLLGGLDRSAASELWSKLDLLYGVRDDFERTWSHSHGNPAYLRRAHAGDHDAELLFADTAACLIGDPRAIALALCVTEIALASHIVARLLPEDRGAVALAHLTACLMIESRGDGLVLHDPVRAALVRAAAPAELQDAHRRLAEVLADAGGDPVRQVRERMRHLLAGGQRAAARTLVLGRAPELVRLGGSSELLRCLDLLQAERRDAVPESDEDVEIRHTRARVLARMLQIRRAYNELAHLSANRDTTSKRVRTSFAQVAMLTGRFEVAERVTRTALADPALDPVLKIRNAVIWLFARTYQGHGESARGWIRDLTHHLEDSPSRGPIALACAVSCCLEQRYVEAEECLRFAGTSFETEPLARAGVLSPVAEVLVLALGGKSDEARDTLARAEAHLRHIEDPLVAAMLRAGRGALHASRGDFAAALDEMVLAHRQLTHGGHAMVGMWAQLHLGKVLLYLGRAREGHAVLDEVARQALEVDAQLIARQTEDARLADPRRAVRDDRRLLPTCPGERRRDRVIAALRALGDHQLALARGHVARLSRPDTLETLDALEHALVSLAAATLARATGDARAPALLDEAIERAAHAGADPEIVVELDAWMRDALTSAETTTSVAIDRTRHAVAVAGQPVVALSSRPALRRLLYALADANGTSVDKARLAMAIWPGKYRADRHDSALWVNLKRLRDLLSGTGLRIVTESTGYSMVAESGFRLVS